MTSATLFFSLLHAYGFAVTLDLVPITRHFVLEIAVTEGILDRPTQRDIGPFRVSLFYSIYLIYVLDYM